MCICLCECLNICGSAFVTVRVWHCAYVCKLFSYIYQIYLSVSQIIWLKLFSLMCLLASHAGMQKSRASSWSPIYWLILCHSHWQDILKCICTICLFDVFCNLWELGWCGHADCIWSESSVSKRSLKTLAFCLVRSIEPELLTALLALSLSRERERERERERCLDMCVNSWKRSYALDVLKYWSDFFLF